MTEIPEHLLNRSRERRAALGLGGDEAGSGAGEVVPAASSTPAKAATPAAPSGPVGRAAAPEPAAPPPPKPDTPVVAAYRHRKRVPFWAMAALSFLPIWAFMYVRAVTQAPVEAAGPAGVGSELFGGCASCHGASGDGGVGYAFTDGMVLDTFPNIEDQLRFVSYGTLEYKLAGIDIYGDPDREGGPHIAQVKGNMPAQLDSAGGGLTDADVLAVVCHERYALGGADPAGEYAEEFEQWCSEDSAIYGALASGETTLATLEAFDDTVIPIGDGPAPGSPAQGG